MTDNRDEIRETMQNALKDKTKHPILQKLIGTDLKKYEAEQTSWALIRYKNTFLGEADCFIDILYNFETYLEMETVYQKEGRLQLGEVLKVNTKDLEQFLMERGDEQVELFKNRLDIIYDRTLETLKQIDDKCEEFKKWKKDLYNNDTTPKELKEFVYPFTKFLIAYQKRHTLISDMRDGLISEIKVTPTEIQVAFIRLHLPQLAGLTVDDFKNLIKIKSARKIYSKIEGNLNEYPIAVLNKQGTGSFVEGNFVICKDREGRIVSKIGTPYGVLTAFDFNVFVVMQSFMAEINNIYILAFSDYALLKRLGFSVKGGANYTLLEKSKKKIANLSMSVSRFVKGRRENITGVDNCPIFAGSYTPTGKTAQKRDSKNPLHLNYFVINPLIADNLNVKYIAWIYIKTWNTLSTPTAKRLYEYLTKKRGNKGLYYEENLKSFCGKMPLETRNITKTKGILKRDLETLKREQIIADYNFTQDGKIGIHFFRGKPKPRLLTGRIEGRQAKLFKELLESGVDDEVALGIVKDCSLDIIKRQLAWLPYRNIQENKAGMLVKAIKENWTIPEEAEKRGVTGEEILPQEISGDKESIETIKKLTNEISRQGVEKTGSPVMDYIAQAETLKTKETITEQEIENKFIEMRGLFKPQDYWQGVEGLIRRYSKDIPEERLKQLADKHKPI